MQYQSALLLLVKRERRAVLSSMCHSGLRSTRMQSCELVPAAAPAQAVIVLDPADEGDVAFWRAHSPAVLEMVEGAGLTAAACPATAFVCQNFACLAPTREPRRLRAALEAPKQAPAARGAAQPVDVSQLLGSKRQ